MSIKIKLFLIAPLFILFSFSVSANDNLGDAFKNGGPLTKVANPGAGGYDTTKTLDTTVADIIQAAISLVGVIFLILMIYGGYLWMTDRGNSDTVEKAKKLITAAVIGLIIVVGAYVITYYVLSKMTENALVG